MDAKQLEDKIRLSTGITLEGAVLWDLIMMRLDEIKTNSIYFKFTVIETDDYRITCFCSHNGLVIDRLGFTDKLGLCYYDVTLGFSIKEDF